MGDDSYTVPKSKVERIEAGAPPSVGATELPTYVPAAPTVGEEELLGQIVREGSVNREALNAIGVETFVSKLERRRNLMEQVRVVANSELLDTLETLVDLMYNKISPYREGV